jgi:tetratricopeptide (TPR) repeat protein
VEGAETVIAAAAAGTGDYLECECHIWRGRIRLARGQTQVALQDATRALELARQTGDAQTLHPALAFAAKVLLAVDRTAQAGKLVQELLADLRERLLAPELGVDLAVELVDLGHPAGTLDEVRPSPWLAAVRAFITGNPTQAAETYAQIGSRPDEAYARLQAARVHLAADQSQQASSELAKAVAFYREVQASAYLAEAAALREGM